MYRRIAPWILVSVLTLLPAAALAADGETEALRRRVEALEQRLAEQEGEPRPLQSSGVEEAEAPGITLGGALRVNYSWLDWDEGDDERYGDFAFDTFRLNADGEVGGLLLSAEYRFYPQYDFHTIHHGWIGYDFNENWQGQLGIHQVPFGLQPYASHNYWFSGAYYVGLEDDYDLGLKVLYENGPWNLALAFYKNAELGDAGNAARYSVDVINNADGGFAGAQDAGNEETNQFNTRLAYDVDHGDLGNTEVGLSGQWGQLYNSFTGDMGDHWAGAVHLNGNYGRWNLQLEAARYAYNPDNPTGFDDGVITMGAYGFSWGVPAEATVGIANLAYTLPLEIGPLDSVTFYSDNTLIDPEEGRFDPVWQNVVGALFAAGPVFTYVDLISAEDMIFLGGDMVGDTDASSGRNTRLNVNFGYYF